MKRKLALILCVVAAIAMIFTLASCGEEKCEHTYSADWSSDENGHWNAATCGCEGEISNYGIHADEKTLGEDGKLTAGKDGLCDTCSYKLCKEHKYATGWSTNETNHWNAATCGCDVKDHDAEHVDENKDGNCDECKYVICDHSPVDAWSSDETYHWKETDCKDCNVDVALKGEHADENEDGRCDTCGYVTSFDYVLKSVIEGLDSEAWFGVNSSVVLENGEETFTKIFDNYTVVKDAFGNTKYYSYYGENDANLFVVYETDYGTFRNIDAEEIAGVAAYEIVFYKVVATNHEDAIKGLYSLAMNGSVDGDGEQDGYSYGLVNTIDEEAGKYSFKFLFTIYESAYEVSVEFEVDAEANAVKSATITIDLYDLADVTIDEENLTYTVNEDAEAISTKYEATQTFGDPMSSEEAPNPHPASKYIIDDLKFVNEDTNEEIEEGDVVEILAGYENKLNLVLSEDLLDLADFQLFEVTTELTKGGMNYPFSLYGNTAGEFAVEISNGLDTLSFTIKVSYVAPQTMSTFAINVDSGTGTSESEVTMYNGQSLMVNAVVSQGCDPTFTAEVTVGEDTAFFAQNENGTYTFKPLMVGDYEIELTSSVASDVTATLKVTVIDPPTIEELLDGEYEGTSSNNWIDINAEFGAENTVVITLDGSVSDWSTGEVTDYSGKATYTYEVNEETGALTLTKTEGDDLLIEAVYVESYRIVVKLTNDLPCKLEKVVEEDPSEKVPTSNPFKVTITDNYGWFDTYEFVADEAGRYTFDVPAGLGVSSGNTYYVDFYANESGAEFSIDLEAGESIDLTYGSLTKGDYYMSFIIGESEPETPVEPGLAGNYTATDDWGNSFDVTITDTTISFTPPRSPMIEWTYTYVDGVLTVYSGDTALTNPMMGGAEVDADKNVFSKLYNNGTTYTLTKKATVSEEGGLAGTYTATDDWGNSFDVVITDTTITFTPPRSPEVVIDYTYENGIITLSSEGEVITNPGAASLTVTNGVATGMMYNMTSYTLTKKTAGGAEEGGLAGTYTATDDWGNSFDVVITDTTITFTPPRSPEVVIDYTYENGIITLSSEGEVITNPGAASLTVTNDIATAMMYNMTSYTLTKKTAGGAEEEEPVVEGGLAGTYTATDDWGNSFTVTITDTTITFAPPRSPMVVLDYTYENGIITLSSEGEVITNPGAASLTVTNDIATAMMYNMTSYTLTKAGASSSDDEEVETVTELVVGDNNVAATGDDMNMTVVTITATANGTYTITVGENGVIVYDYSPVLEGESFTVEVEAGDVITLEVNNMYGNAGVIVVTVEFEEEKVVDPQAELKGLLSNYTYKIGDYSVGLTQNWETGVYYINVTDADWTIDLGFTYELTDNGDGTFTIINLASYDMGYASGADQADAVKAAVEGQSISANLTNNAVIGYHQLNGYQLGLSRNTETGAYEANISDDAWTTDLYFTYVATENADGTFTIALTYTQVDWEAGSDKVDSLLAMDWVVTLVAE